MRLVSRNGRRFPLSGGRWASVKLQEVILIHGNATDGGLFASGMRSMPVVAREPGTSGLVSRRQFCLGPLAQLGLDEELSRAAGLGGVGPGRKVLMARSVQTMGW